MRGLISSAGNRVYVSNEMDVGLVGSQLNRCRKLHNAVVVILWTMRPDLVVMVVIGCTFRTCLSLTEYYQAGSGGTYE